MSTKNLLTSNPHPAYRPDIDGLRAIAISLVVAFHAFPSQVQGGFVGVDIFFVISGFLISSIIFKGLEQGSFSYTDFYVRRIKRIFPALILVLTACLVFGWFTLLQGEYKSLGKHAASGAGFISNFILWSESGYFDTAAGFKPLLHLWSLGIEEQFYIAWPLLLALLWKRMTNLLLAVSILLLMSFLSNVGLINSNPVATFYFPLTRFWELLLGSLLAYVTLFRGGLIAAALSHAGIKANHQSQVKIMLSEASASLGILLIIAAAILLNKDKAFPGWWALLPTTGTVLLIAAGSQAWLNRKVLSHRIPVFLGLISYPLYLWHWPILSFANIVNYGTPPPWVRIGAIVLSIALAWLANKLIEKPIQARRNNLVPVILSALVLFIPVAGYYIHRSDGLSFRAANKSGNLKNYTASIPKNAEIRARYITDNCNDISNISPLTNRFCRSYGPRDRDAIVVWGDSHADAWAPVFFEIANEKNLRVIILSHHGCPPIVGIRRTDGQINSQNCSLFGVGEDIVSAIQAIKPKHIFMVARWSLYAHGWLIEGNLQPATHFITTDPGAPANIDSSWRALESQLFTTLQLLTKDFPVTVFRTIPILKTHVEKGLIRNLPLEPTIAEHKIFETTPDQVIDKSLNYLGNLDVFDPASLLCDQTCRAVINGTVYYADDNHVTAQGALQFKELLVQKHFGFLKPPALHDASFYPLKLTPG